MREKIGAASHPGRGADSSGRLDEADQRFAAGERQADGCGAGATPRRQELEHHEREERHGQARAAPEPGPASREKWRRPHIGSTSAARKLSPATRTPENVRGSSVSEVVVSSTGTGASTMAVSTIFGACES